MGVAPRAQGGPGDQNTASSQEGAATEREDPGRRAGTASQMQGRYQQGPGDAGFSEEQLLFLQGHGRHCSAVMGNLWGSEGPWALVWLRHTGPWGHLLPLLFLLTRP